MHAADSSGQGVATLSDPSGVPWDARLGQALWRASELGRAPGRVLPSGHAALDRELPGGGWPGQSLTDLLVSPGLGCEWRLLGPALRRACAAGEAVVLVGSPAGQPHGPGLAAWGVPARQVVWLKELTPSQALWATEQALHCRQTAAVLAWLPQARPEALRRLHAHAQRGEAPLFVFRPEACRAQSCAAPLRLVISAGRPWSLKVQLLKRRGPPHDGHIELPVLPSGLAPLIAPRLRSLMSPARPAPVRSLAESQDVVSALGTSTSAGIAPVLAGHPRAGHPARA